MNTIDSGLAAERQAKLDALGPRPAWWRVFARSAWMRDRSRIMTMSVSKMAAMLRCLYPPERIEELAHRQHPALSMIRKGKP